MIIDEIRKYKTKKTFHPTHPANAKSAIVNIAKTIEKRRCLGIHRFRMRQKRQRTGSRRGS